MSTRRQCCWNGVRLSPPEAVRISPTMWCVSSVCETRRDARRAETTCDTLRSGWVCAPRGCPFTSCRRTPTTPSRSGPSTGCPNTTPVWSRPCLSHSPPTRPVSVCVCVCPNMLKFNQASCLHVIRQVKLILTKCLENSYLNCNNISQYYCFYCIFGQINSALVSIRDFKIIKSLNYSELLTGSILYFSPNPQWKHFTRLNFTHIITYGELQYDLSAPLQTQSHTCRASEHYFDSWRCVGNCGRVIHGLCSWWCLGFPSEWSVSWRSGTFCDKPSL